MKYKKKFYPAMAKIDAKKKNCYIGYSKYAKASAV